jgi:hypothetical protein
MGCTFARRGFIINFMPRIAGIEPSQANLFTRFVYWMTKRRLGRLIVPLKVTAHSQRLFGAMCHMEFAQQKMHSNPGTLTELASIKVATMVGCPF